MKQVGTCVIATLIMIVQSIFGSITDVPQYPRPKESGRVVIATEPAPDVAGIWQEIGAVPEDQTENGVPVGKLNRKLLGVSICPCLAEEHAQWDMARWGYTGYDGEPMNSILLDFRTYLTAHYGELADAYGELLDSTIWIVDSDRDLIYLQIIGIEDGAALQRLMLQWNGGEITVFEGGKPLEGYVSAMCAKYLTKEARQRAEKEYNWLQETKYGQQWETDMLFYRVSSLKRGVEMETRVFWSPEKPDMVRFQTCSFTSLGYWDDPISLHEIHEEKAPELTPELEYVLNKIDFSQNWADEYGVGFSETMLRYYLMRYWNSDGERYWDEPLDAHGWSDSFGVALYSLKNLLKEMDLNPELKSSVESMPTWKLEDVNLYTCSITGTTDQGKTLTARGSFRYVLVDGFTTSYQQRLQTLAEEGENSDQIPAEIKQEFIDFLSEYALPYDGVSTELVALNYGTVSWAWSIKDDGSILLETIYTEPDSIYGKGDTSILGFERKPNGEISQIYRDVIERW